MTTIEVLRGALAVIAASTVHVAALSALRPPEPRVLIQGGGLQVEFGLDASLVASSGAGGEGGEHVDETEAVNELTEEPKQADRMAEAVKAAPDSAPPLPETPPVASIMPDANSPPNDEPTADAGSTEISALPAPKQAPPAEQPPAPEAPEEPHAETAPEPAPPLEQYAEETAEPPTSEQSAPFGFNAAPSSPVIGDSQEVGNSASANYAGEVMRHLSRVRRPRASGPGSAFVSFTLGAGGALERLAISTSSGSSRFDRDALRVVERAAPFPEPPAGVNRDFVVEIEGR